MSVSTGAPVVSERGKGGVKSGADVDVVEPLQEDVKVF